MINSKTNKEDNLREVGKVKMQSENGLQFSQVYQKSKKLSKSCELFKLFNIVSLMIEYDKERKIKISLYVCKWMGMY